MSRKEITEARQLRGKKVAATSGAGSTTFMAYQVLRRFGLEPGKDVEVILLGGAPQGRLGILENGTVDAAFLSVPENISQPEKVLIAGFWHGSSRFSAKRFWDFTKANSGKSR